MVHEHESGRAWYSLTALSLLRVASSPRPSEGNNILDSVPVECETSGAGVVSVLPRIRVGSVGDVLSFYADKYLRAVNLLKAAGDSALFSMSQAGGAPPKARRDILSALTAASLIFYQQGGLPVSPSLRGQLERLLAKVKGWDEEVDAQAVVTLTEEVYKNLLVELGACWFLMVPPERRGVYVDASSSFGPEVLDVFPDANRDIAAAARCLALDEWTACVFHLMRVVEHGIRHVATMLNISLRVLVKSCGNSLPA